MSFFDIVRRGLGEPFPNVRDAIFGGNITFTANFNRVFGFKIAFGCFCTIIITILGISIVILSLRLHMHKTKLREGEGEGGGLE